MKSMILDAHLMFVLLTECTNLAGENKKGEAARPQTKLGHLRPCR